MMYWCLLFILNQFNILKNNVFVTTCTWNSNWIWKLTYLITIPDITNLLLHQSFRVDQSLNDINQCNVIITWFINHHNRCAWIEFTNAYTLWFFLISVFTILRGAFSPANPTLNKIDKRLIVDSLWWQTKSTMLHYVRHLILLVSELPHAYNRTRTQCK